MDHALRPRLIYLIAALPKLGFMFFTCTAAATWFLHESCIDQHVAEPVAGGLGAAVGQHASEQAVEALADRNYH